MPSRYAARGDSAIARSARPSWVFFSASSSTAMSANDRKMIPSSSAVTSTPPKLSVRSGSNPAGNRMFCAPKIPCTALVRMMPTPIVAIIGIRCGAPRARNGRSTSRSITSPTQPLAANAATSAPHSGSARCATACSAAYAPTMNTAPCERLITPSTPKISVNPSANSAYTHPSDSALTSCCASTIRFSPMATRGGAACRVAPSGVWIAGAVHARRGRRGPRLLLDHELAALGHAHDRGLLRVVAGRLARLVGRAAELERAGRAGPLHRRQRVAQRAALGGQVTRELDRLERLHHDVHRVVRLGRELVRQGVEPGLERLHERDVLGAVVARRPRAADVQAVRASLGQVEHLDRVHPVACAPALFQKLPVLAFLEP